MNNCQAILIFNGCYKGAFSKAKVLIIILYFASCHAQAQFVDIAIDLHAPIELTSLSHLQDFQKPDGTLANSLNAMQNKKPGLTWTRIRTIENMSLTVKIRFCDPVEAIGDKCPAYLNDGSDKIMEARCFIGNRSSFPVNCNTFLRARMNSPPQNFDAWIGIPARLVQEVQIEYN